MDNDARNKEEVQSKDRLFANAAYGLLALDERCWVHG